MVDGTATVSDRQAGLRHAGSASKVRARWFSMEMVNWTLIGIGALLRIAQYASNRSLWFDESFLALNVLNRSLGGLLRPLDYGQGAPIGFLVLEKLLAQTFGDSEYVLRLVPLLAGLIALVLFYRVARDTIRPGAVPIALGLLVILDPLIYYASEVKQYSSDVAVALILLCSAQAALGKRGALTVPRTLVFALTGAVALWFSHPATFVLMGVGAAALAVGFRDADWVRMRRLAMAGLVWIISLGLLYYVSLRQLRTNTELLTYWGNAFLPFPPSPASVRWLGATFFKIFEYPVGLIAPGIGVGTLAFLVGATALWTENWGAFLALILPLVFALGASAFHLYPFADRLLLFGVPFIVLFIGEGAAALIEAAKPRLPWTGVILVGLLVLHPALSATSSLVKPRTLEEIRPVVAYLRAHEQSGDAVYLYYGAVPAFKYYARRYGFGRDSYVEGVYSRGDRGRYVADLDRLRGRRRAWFVFSHLYKDEEEFFLSYLDSRGRKVESFVRDGAGTYLYDLGK